MTRRRFQFRLRTLMIVVTLAAVLAAIATPRLREWRRYRQAREDVEKYERLKSKSTGDASLPSPALWVEITRTRS